MGKKLIIVESPNKTKTIKQFLGDDYIVMASVGHITKIADSGLYNMGIDVNNDFAPDIIVDPGKKDVVKQLKEQLKSADTIYLATDGDREGEAIAYNLKNILKIADSKYYRIVYHEITKTAITNAIENARKIDNNMYESALTRAILDKIVGFRITPLALTKAGCKSAGRVQSAALKILADRENEIINFVPSTFYEIWLPFVKNAKTYRVQYKGTDKKKISSLPSKTSAEKVIADCAGGKYIVKSIESKDRSVQAKPPFTTSTFQQEVSSKLGYSSDKAMSSAQKLFEGIDLGGNHVALITYIRTDSTEMSSEFVAKLNDFVKTNYGKNYYSPVKQGKKTKNMQDGHEALRVVDLEMTPSKLATYISDNQLLKVYRIIYERTVASAMADCIMTDTEYSIYNGQHKFSYSLHDVKFDGFKKVYGYSDDDEADEKYPKLALEEELKTKDLELVEKQTTPPSRYTEATLIKKMEESGIGRPSTYASTMKTLQDPDRGYTEKSGKSLKVTEKGLRLSKFLDEAFGDIINLTYTSEMEAKLDEIANGKLSRIEFLKDFYKNLCDKISIAKGIQATKEPAVSAGKKCPTCGKDLVIRHGKYGDFIACSGFPRCKYTEKIETSQPASTAPAKKAAVDMGVACPDCGKPIVKREGANGQYWYGCSGFPKHKRIFTEAEVKKLIERQSINKNSSLF